LVGFSTVRTAKPTVEELVPAAPIAAMAARWNGSANGALPATAPTITTLATTFFPDSFLRVRRKLFTQ